MKYELLREYVRETLKTEMLVEKKEKIKSLDDVKTVGHLRSLIKHSQRKKSSKVGGKGLADTAIDIVVDEIQALIPGFATVKNLAMAAKNAYSLPDEAKAGALAALDVDDDVSKVLDDAVENLFFKDYLDGLKSYPDDTELEDIDVTKALTNWMKKKYNNTNVTKGE